MNLVLNERKSLSTLTYIIVIIMAYFGPNAELLGNVKLAIWHFQKPIKDIEAYVINVCLLLAVDLLSLVFNGILLWYSCKTNIFKVLNKLQKEFWYAFAIIEAFSLVEVIFYFQNKEGSNLVTFHDSRHSYN